MFLIRFIEIFCARSVCPIQFLCNIVPAYKSPPMSRELFTEVHFANLGPQCWRDLGRSSVEGAFYLRVCLSFWIPVWVPIWFCILCLFFVLVQQSHPFAQSSLVQTFCHSLTRLILQRHWLCISARSANSNPHRTPQILMGGGSETFFQISFNHISLDNLHGANLPSAFFTLAFAQQVVIYVMIMVTVAIVIVDILLLLFLISRLPWHYTQLPISMFVLPHHHHHHHHGFGCHHHLHSPHPPHILWSLGFFQRSSQPLQLNSFCMQPTPLHHSWHHHHHLWCKLLLSAIFIIGIVIIDNVIFKEAYYTTTYHGSS